MRVRYVLENAYIQVDEKHMLYIGERSEIKLMSRAEVWQLFQAICQLRRWGDEDEEPPETD